MPKGSNVPARSGSSAKERRSGKRRQHSRGPVLTDAQRVMPQPGAPTPVVVKREETPVGQTASQSPYLLRDLIRSAVIAGALLILLIVLYVAL